jgi:hypothetical protein
VSRRWFIGKAALQCVAGHAIAAGEWALARRVNRINAGVLCAACAKAQLNLEPPVPEPDRKVTAAGGED